MADNTDEMLLSLGVKYTKMEAQHHIIMLTEVPADAAYHNGRGLEAAGYSGGIVLKCHRFPCPTKEATLRSKLRGVGLCQKTGPDGIAKEQLKCGKSKKMANRFHFVPALLKSGDWDNENITISHLCHNPACTNAKHLTMEELDINKGRNGCMGGTCCGHLPACLRPGPKVLK